MKSFGPGSLRVHLRLLTALSVGAAAGLAALTASGQTTAPAAPPPAKAAEPASKFKGEDGWVDVSGFLDEAYGFLPIAMPITEPAVGYGLGGGLMFLDQPLGNAEYKRPNITAVFGFGTENGTWGAGAGDIRMWMDDKLQTIAAGFRASVNLDFFGVGEDPILAEHPLRYNLDLTGGVLMGKYLLGKSRWSLGMGYVYVATDVTFNAPASTPGLPDFTSETKVGGILPSISYDTRDNVLTPTKGLYLEATLATFNPGLGADEDYQRGTLLGLYFRPLGPKLFLGLKGQVTSTFGEPPFFLQPYVQMRGVSAMRYQGQQVAQGEAELRWQFWKRFSLVGFAGAGQAWGEIRGTDYDRSVFAGGAGFRYEIARKYGIHAGIDVAWGPDDTAIYVQVGSAWMRP